ncbi:MAG: hypothetical protein K9J16_18810 [Melioribacteraceae bacterium]|nr:hypothetical protein [Melioribacteraceae bacterium]MCF8356943.1 hypothetical protein [Melioribacteraceae bacterium]MCF8396382.1 hypothetical protein [Melioribacteraceae bacterium]
MDILTRKRLPLLFSGALFIFAAVTAFEAYTLAALFYFITGAANFSASRFVQNIKGTAFILVNFLNAIVLLFAAYSFNLPGTKCLYYVYLITGTIYIFTIILILTKSNNSKVK